MNNEQPYEIHITIKDGDSVKFSLACERAFVKPVYIENYVDGKVFHDKLTSSSISTNDWGIVMDEVVRIGKALTDSGFEIARAKVETWPFHASAPTILNNNPMPKDCYFEAHVAVTASDAWMDQLAVIAKRHGAHLSRNLYRRAANGTYPLMFTLRNHTSPRGKFLEQVNALEDDLTLLGFEFEEPEAEFAVYDTNLKHDEAWMGKAA